MEKKKTFHTVVFADGASSGNPGPGGWGAIVATPEGEIIELGAGFRQVTNNQMELSAVIGALERLPDHPHPIGIYTDSTYVIRGITQWVWGWLRKGWKTAEGKDVANADMWRKLLALVGRQKKIAPIEWHYVRGHSGIPGNERVDQIAVEFSKGTRPRLYQGALLSYDVPVHDIPENTELPPEKPRNNGDKSKPYSYLSLVGGTPMRHATWAECERRVKGQSGAKFKKAMSADEEEQILKSWGVR
jgi:ribonuclease HI